ncbi:MAG: DNA mismatch repair protein MutS, partial [Candidatus Eremiobacteraeota bacterium]|nr:DNA mismatch repair protein MutS [Candidatus Eremiobacteraeota bacterium]
MTKYSPMLEQYFGMKAKHPEAILLSRVGDFYEAYGEDAEIIAKALQIALTSKEAGGGRRVAMAGVPHHALGQYLARLVHQRFIVALAEQLEMPQPNRLVRRDIVRLVTPGTLVEDQLLEGGRNNYLAAVTIAGESFALAYADVSTGYSEATAISGDGAYEEVLAELLRVEPTEIVADLPAGLRATIAGTLESSGTRVTTSTLRIVDDRQRPSFGGFSLDESLAIARAVDALGDFIKRTGVSNGERATATPRLYRRQQYVAIDPATRKHLELTSTQGRNPRATLLATLDRCVTTMGSRLLGRWILAPLVDTGEIAQRADAIEALASQHARREAIREI